MTQDELIEMARQAGIDHHKLWNDDGTNNLEAFAKLVASAASAKEREACAKVCEWYSVEKRANINYSEECAYGIRARAQADGGEA